MISPGERERRPRFVCICIVGGAVVLHGGSRRRLYVLGIFQRRSETAVPPAWTIPAPHLKQFTPAAGKFAP